MKRGRLVLKIDRDEFLYFLPFSILFQNNSQKPPYKSRRVQFQRVIEGKRNSFVGLFFKKQMGALVVGAVDRGLEWNEACRKALGLEPESSTQVLDPEHYRMLTEEPPSIKILNLIPPELRKREEYIIGSSSNRDKRNSFSPWSKAITSIDQSIDQMIDWIEEKMFDYTSVHMSDEEAFLIQSTVTSFTASTAREIEALRTMMISTSQPQRNNGETQRDQHQQSMVQILMGRLKEIAIVFGRLQKQRNRAAVQLWNNPLQCRLVAPTSHHDNAASKDSLDEVLGLDDDEQDQDSRYDVRFYPSMPTLSLQKHFLETYEKDETIRVPPRPASIFQKRSLPSDSRESSKRSRRENSKVIEQPKYIESSGDYIHEKQLQQEAVLLKASVGNELDEVQQLEHMMTDITRLLTQFSDLVAEQQEEVIQIYEATSTSKSNVEKGQEHLSEATQRTKSSKHYMATTITALSIVLLIFHWIHP